MCRELKKLLLIGCLTESTWNPRSKSNMLTPETNLLTFWPKEVSREMGGITFCVCLISWVFRHILAAISNFSLSSQRAPCDWCHVETRTRHYLEWMDLRWQKSDLPTWWCTVSAKRTSRHKDRDLWSICRMTTTEKELAWPQESGVPPARTSK